MPALLTHGTNFNVVADRSKSPKMLEVAEPRTGCRWNAVAPDGLFSRVRS